MTRLSTSSVLAGLALIGTMSNAHALLAIPMPVSTTYQGTIVEDSGLGLNGQTMFVGFTYDAATPPSAWDANSFEGAILAMTVSIGPNTWTYDVLAPWSYDYISLTNDKLVIFAAGIEDRWNASAYEFSGPSLTTDPAFGYSLDMYFYDNAPTGAPDGLTDDTALPTTAPDPAIFTSYYESVMQFSFFTGDPETGDYYYIEAEGLSQVTAVPEPETYAMWLAGLGLLGGVARRRAR